MYTKYLYKIHLCKCAGCSRLLRQVGVPELYCGLCEYISEKLWIICRSGRWGADVKAGYWDTAKVRFVEEGV